MTSIELGLVALGFVLVVIGLVRMAASIIDGFFASISCDVAYHSFSGPDRWRENIQRARGW